MLEGHTGGMNISLDGQANDGSPGEGDNVGSDFEQINGTDANDNFTGRGGNDKFSGGGGNDEMHGGGGADNLVGDGGDDRVYGDAGNDKVEGTSGADIVDGGPAATRSTATSPTARSSALRRGPALRARRRARRRGLRRRGRHGAGRLARPRRVLLFGRPLGPTGERRSTPPAEAGVASLLAVAKSIKIKTLIRRGLVFRYKCAAACKVTATLTYKGKKLGAGRKSLLAAGPAKLVVKLSKKAKRKVRRAKRGKLTFRLKVTDAAGAATTVTKTVRFKR